MLNTQALVEFKNMWTWLYGHPAHDAGYYVKHVAKAEPLWEKNCPICEFSEGACRDCLAIYDNGNGNLCDDPDSPMNKWRSAHLGDPDFRTWYAGKIVGLATAALDK